MVTDRLNKATLRVDTKISSREREKYQVQKPSAVGSLNGRPSDIDSSNEQILLYPRLKERSAMLMYNLEMERMKFEMKGF